MAISQNVLAMIAQGGSGGQDFQQNYLRGLQARNLMDEQARAGQARQLLGQYLQGGGQNVLAQLAGADPNTALQLQQVEAQNARQAADDAWRLKTFTADQGYRAAQLEADRNKLQFAPKGSVPFQGGKPMAMPGAVAGEAIPDLEEELKLRKSFETSPGVSRYREVFPTLASMKKSLNDPSVISDLDFVYGVAKILDPTSVVRESEQGNIIAAQSLPQKTLGYLNKILLGQEAINRPDLFRLAMRRASEFRTQAEGERQFSVARGKPHGIGPESFREIEPLPDWDDPTVDRPQAGAGQFFPQATVDSVMGQPSAPKASAGQPYTADQYEAEMRRRGIKP